MLSEWHIPSWSGDFEFKSDGENSRLIVVDPTVGELEDIGNFLEKARKKGWIAEAVGITPKGRTEITLSVPVAESGKLFLGRKAPRKGIITAIKHLDGELEVVKGSEAIEPAVSKSTAKEAVTTRRPTLSCPECVTGPDLRASKVLRSFSTPRQWQEWRDQGLLHAYGHLSGHRYRICHRHSDLAQRQGKIVWDETDDVVVHAYDWSVPPAEEVLSMKLAIEHAEPWIRNRSSLHDAPGATDVYTNPFMTVDQQILDGTWDTGVIGGVLGGLLGDLLCP